VTKDCVAADDETGTVTLVDGVDRRGKVDILRWPSVIAHGSASTSTSPAAIRTDAIEQNPVLIGMPRRPNGHWGSISVKVAVAVHDASARLGGLPADPSNPPAHYAGPQAANRLFMCAAYKSRPSGRLGVEAVNFLRNARFRSLFASLCFRWRWNRALSPLIADMVTQA
jgi:hypothetical protein